MLQTREFTNAELAELLEQLPDIGPLRAGIVAECVKRLRAPPAGISPAPLAADEGYERMRKALTIIANWTLPETGKFWDEEKTRPTSFESEYGSNGARSYMRNLAGMALLAAAPRAAPSQGEVSGEGEG